MSIKMNKISYRIVYNRKKRLNAEGKALLQVEAYLKGKRIYFSTNIYLTPKQWDNKKKMIKSHVAAGSLNYYLREFITKLELRELELWKQRGQERLGVWFEMLRLLLTDNKYWILLIDENVGKSSVSCPLKPGDSAPLKHSTMPP